MSEDLEAMLPLRGQRRALFSLASQLSAGISARQVQRCSANHQIAAPVAALADKVHNASQGPGGHSHENCRTSWMAEQMRPWQQGQKNDQYQATILAASLPFISRHTSPMALSTLPLQLSAMRMAHSSAGPETRSDLRQGTQDSRRFRRSAPHTHRSPSRVSGAVRHSSNDGSSGPDGYSKTSEPPGSPGKHSLESPTAWRPAGRPESGPLRQDTQPVRQQAGFQRSQNFQLNGPGTRPPPPGYQRPAAWWQPPPAHQPRSPPGALQSHDAAISIVAYVWVSDLSLHSGKTVGKDHLSCADVWLPLQVRRCPGRRCSRSIGTPSLRHLSLKRRSCRMTQRSDLSARTKAMRCVGCCLRSSAFPPLVAGCCLLDWIAAYKHSPLQI